MTQIRLLLIKHIRIPSLSTWTFFKETESLPVSLSLFPSSSCFSSTTTSWAPAKPSSSPGIPCQQFTRPHPVWSNKETRAISCLSFCQPPPSALLLTFPLWRHHKERRDAWSWQGEGETLSLAKVYWQCLASADSCSFFKGIVKRDHSFCLIWWLVLKSWLSLTSSHETY